MARTQAISVKSPLGGVYKRSDFQSQEPRTWYDSRDIWPYDAGTGRKRLAVRPGFSSTGSLNSANMLVTLHSAAGETYGRQLMAAAGGSLYRWTGSAWSSVGSSITSGSTVHAAGYNGFLYIACTTTHRKYEYSGHAVTNWTAASAGTIPANCRLVCLWNARIVLAGDPANPGLVNFSRVDDPEDWDVAETDIGSAVTVNIQEPVTALIPHNRECLIVGTAQSLYIFRGNPAGGGATLDKIAHVVGPISSLAWCKTPDDWTYMLTRDGLYRMPPGCGTTPTSISREKIPEALLGLDGVNYKAYLEYDVRFRCIHIYAEGATPQRYHYFLESEAFCPVTSPGASILAIHRYDPLDTATTSGVLIGTSSGVKKLDTAQTLGGSDLAFVTIGPFKMSATPGVKNRMDEAITVLGDLTNDTTGTLDFYAAANGEDVVALPASRKFSTTIGALINSPRCFPMIAGHAMVLKYTQGATDKIWAFEELTGLLTNAGRET